MTTEVSAKEKGEFLEDTVADLFRSWGFDVQRRIRLKDKYEVEHEIDVLGTKKEAFGTVVIAVECKYVKSPIDIKEVRNFHDKLSALGIMKGILVSVGGFTSEAGSHAKAVGLELWDLAALQEKIGRVETPKNRVDNALALNPGIANIMLPTNLTNNEKLSIVGEAEILYVPYYFVEYHCFSQDRVGGEIVTLESKGNVAIEAKEGRIVDMAVSLGVVPNLPNMGGNIVACGGLEPKTIYVDQAMPQELAILREQPYYKIERVQAVASPYTLRETEAKSIVQKEVTKSLSVRKRYVVGRRIREKIVRPKRKDVEVVGCTFYNIPFLTINLQYRDKVYKRRIQAATGVVVYDESLYCTTCKRNFSSVVCEKCGNVVCGQHSKSCLVCGRKLCDSCVVSKGLLLKKYYCSEHAPA